VALRGFDSYKTAWCLKESRGHDYLFPFLQKALRRDDELRNYILHLVNDDQNDSGLVFIGGTEAQLGSSSPAPIECGHLIVTAWDAAQSDPFEKIRVLSSDVRKMVERDLSQAASDGDVEAPLHSRVECGLRCDFFRFLLSAKLEAKADRLRPRSRRRKTRSYA